MTNPFEVHNHFQALYEKRLAVPIDGRAGNFITYLNEQYPATISPFRVMQRLKPDGGGFQSFLTGQAIVRKEVLPAGTVFKSGYRLSATQVNGSTRDCQVDSVEDTMTEWRLNLWDVNYKA